MSIFIEIFPASYGDCFLVRLERENSESFNILIDGGITVGNPHKDKLIDRLKEIKILDLLIVTHIDNDHIQGVINLLEQNENDTIIIIKEIWFNGFKHIHHYKGITERPTPDHISRLDKRTASLKVQSLSVAPKTISADNAHNSLTPLIMKSNIPWNLTFSGKPIIMEKDIENKQPKKYHLREDIVVQILTPTNEILSELDKSWLGELNSKHIKYDAVKDPILTQAVEYLLAQTEMQLETDQIKEVSANQKSIEDYSNIKDKEDNAINNRSSISFILEFEDKKLLFLGDAIPSDIITALNNQPTTFDLIKVSHHGSKKNTTKPLLAIIDAPHFIISTDGKQYKHPDMECLAKIVNRPTETSRSLIFNYPTVNAYHVMKNTEWQTTYKYKLHPTTEEVINIIKL